MTATWTVAGDPSVETLIGEVVGGAATAITRNVPAHALMTAAVIGGYGRGEGGVMTEDGAARPHNNLDLLIVTRGSDRVQPDVAAALDRELQRLARTAAVPIDVGWVTESQLRRSAPRVMWYDVRFGHRVLAGDHGFLRGLQQFRAERIGAAEVVDLMTNRGALAVIAQALLASPTPGEWARRTAVKNAMKAIVGYGDALLWHGGRYHWSYREKARRMQRAVDIDAGLQQLYADAIEFRFRPCYARYAGADRAWLDAVTETLERAHLDFARRLLRRPLTWTHYPDALLGYLLRHREVRGWAQLAREVSGKRPRPRVDGVASWLAHLSTNRHRVAAGLPAACYGTPHASRRLELITAWAATCDVNFPQRLRTELGLEEPT